MPPSAYPQSDSATTATASTTAESSPDTAMRHAMLPIVPGEDLHPYMTGPGGNEGFWANLRQRTSMRRTNNTNEGDGRDNAEGGDAVRKGKWRFILRMSKHMRRVGQDKLCEHKVRRTRDLTNNDGDFPDKDGEQKRRRGPMFPSWAYKGTKSKDYGNADIDRLGYVAAESDVEKDADNSSLNSSFMAPPSGGVLSALLTLYNAQNVTASESIPPSGAPTPTIQEESTSNTREHKESRRARQN
ncbi:hypothetical protein EV368DRAFT_86896 [Lentinula lateritia]|nr:hypothetical protein EV368DRAFT_86896 [Lentinula lateritia]